MPTLPRQGAINAHLLSHVQVGDELDVWWPLDKVYYPGVVGAIESDGRHRIDYTDGDVEHVFLTKERWKFRGKSAERVMRALINPRHTAPPHDHDDPHDQHDDPPNQDVEDVDVGPDQEEPHVDVQPDDIPAEDDPDGGEHPRLHVEHHRDRRSFPRDENGLAQDDGHALGTTPAKTRWRKAKGRGRGAIVK